MPTSSRDYRAAPRTADWMRRTRNLAQAMAAPVVAVPQRTLEDIAWEHLALLQHLAAITGQPESFTPSITATARALGLQA